MHHAELENGPTLDTMRAIKAAATDRNHVARLDFAAGEIRGGSVDAGNHSKHPLARVNGECGIDLIGLNAAYLADVAERFADIESASIKLTMTDPGSPVGVTSGCKPYFRAVVDAPARLASRNRARCELPRPVRSRVAARALMRQATKGHNQ